MPFEIVQRVVDFPVGSHAARHVNGGPAFITLLDGELTMVAETMMPEAFDRRLSSSA